MRSPFLTEDAHDRAIGEHYYPLLRAEFLARYDKTENDGVQIAVQEGAGVGACLLPGVDGELEHIVLRNTIRYDWTTARVLQAEINELDDEAKRWLPPKESQGLRLTLFGLLTQVHTSISRENRQHKPGGSGADPPIHLAADLRVIAPEIAKARRRLEQDAQRASQGVYADGMAFGAAWLALLCLVIAGFFIWRQVPAVNGIAAIAGGAGAGLSVLQRMTSGSLELDYKSDPRMLKIFGGIRPFVGAIFGMIVFCIIKAGLLPTTLVPPKNTGALLAFVAVFGFLAGFNERFFQDMLQSASQGVGSKTPGSAAKADHTSG